MKMYSGLDSLPAGHASDELTNGCLCLEGGAFRGLYSEGVLDCLMQRDINFNCVIGVSAGALNGLNYVARQIGRSARTNLRYRHDMRYIGGPHAIREGHSLLNLKFLFDEVEERDPLDRDAFFDPRRRFIAVATDAVTGETRYYDRDECKDIEAAVRASASMPFVALPVEVDGTPCLDGGCSCKIPYQWAIDRGYRKIVVVRTQDRAYRKPVREKKHALRERVYRRVPGFAEVLSRSTEDYNLACDELEALEASGRVFVIAPSEPVTVTRLEPDMEKLGALYWLGYHDMEAETDRLIEYLAR